MAGDDEVQLAPEDEARWWRERGERELCEILFWRWDPIGIQGELPYSAGEYDGYAPRVVATLQRGASAREIAAVLSSIERDEIGARSDSRAAAAKFIVQWYDNSRRYWREFESGG